MKDLLLKDLVLTDKDNPCKIIYLEFIRFIIAIVVGIVVIYFGYDLYDANLEASVPRTLKMFGIEVDHATLSVILVVLGFFIICYAIKKTFNIRTSK